MDCGQLSSQPEIEDLSAKKPQRNPTEEGDSANKKGNTKSTAPGKEAKGLGLKDDAFFEVGSDNEAEGLENHGAGSEDDEIEDQDEEMASSESDSDRSS